MGKPSTYFAFAPPRIPPSRHPAILHSRIPAPHYTSACNSFIRMGCATQAIPYQAWQEKSNWGCAQPQAAHARWSSAALPAPAGCATLLRTRGAPSPLRAPQTPPPHGRWAPPASGPCKETAAEGEQRATGEGSRQRGRLSRQAQAAGPHVCQCICPPGVGRRAAPPPGAPRSSRPAAAGRSGGSLFRDASEWPA